MDAPNEPAGEKFILKPKEFERVNAPLQEELTPPIVVETILQDNASRGNAVAPLVLDLKRKVSRRTRDYLLLLGVGNAVILVGMSFLPSDPLLRVFGWSAAGLFTLGLSWVMWGVMGDY